MKKVSFILSALFLLFTECINGGVNLVQIKENKPLNAEYSSILCFRILQSSQVSYTNKKGRHDIENVHWLRYFNGAELQHVAIKFHGYTDEKGSLYDEIIYLAAKPGDYDLLDFFDPGGTGTGASSGGGTSVYRTPDLSYPINILIRLDAGKVTYTGIVRFNFDEKGRSTYSLFRYNNINDTLTHDFETKYSTVFNDFKNNLTPASFFFPKPLQAKDVIFSSKFTESEGIWKDSADSLHKSYFENGLYFIEGASGYKAGAEIIELPEKLGNTFEVELRCRWKKGLNTWPYGFIIPKDDILSSKRYTGAVKPNGYLFGVSGTGYACIWYEDYKLRDDVAKSKITRVGLTDWKIIPGFKINDTGENVLRVQVTDKVITYYVNNIFISRSPRNSFPGIETYHDFLNTGSNLIGVFSYNSQAVEFDEIKVSRF